MPMPEAAQVKEKTESVSDEAKAIKALARQTGHIAAAEALLFDVASLTEYEKERAHRIKRNAALIEQLQLKQLVSDLASSIQSKSQRKSGRPNLPRKNAGKSRAVHEIEPARRSTRQRSGSCKGSGNQSQKKTQTAKDSEGEALASCEEYFGHREGKEPGISVSGSFQGWVNPEVCQRYGIAASPEEAASKGAAASQTLGSAADTGLAASHGRGWSKAQLIASKQLQTNPNAYFYRHVAPHEQQAQGDWTSEEHDLFMKTVREHGAGDRWGLFSSYIPQRVGYQCSNYYRDIVIARGLVFDPRYRMNKSGKAVYIG